MNFVAPIYLAALPDMFMLAMIALILVADIIFQDKKSFFQDPILSKGSLAFSRHGVYFLTQVAIIISFFLTFAQYQQFREPVITFSNNYIVDHVSILTKLLVLVISFFAFIYAHGYVEDRRIRHSEYYITGLIGVLGMMVMASGYSFLTIYLGLELLSIPLYAMCAMQKDSRAATEAAMKYFVMGTFASALLLYGISLVYGVSGSIDIASLSHLLHPGNSTNSLVVTLGLIFILVGLIFKFGAVPFHMWVPDVYQGAPTSVTLFIASAPKIAALAITFRILVEALPGFFIQWQHVLIVVAVLSMFFGNLLAIAQTNIKRMLAYSSIAHIGYMLLGLIAGPHDPQGYSAAMFYVFTYVIVAAGAFAIIGMLSQKGIEFDRLEDYQGLNARNPWLAFMMLLLMFSMAGVPPTVGFFAKLGLLEALVHAHFVWLAVFALVFSIIGAYYYLRVVMIMYFEEPKPEYANSFISVRPGLFIAVSVNGIAALILGLLPSSLIDICRVTFASV